MPILKLKFMQRSTLTEFCRTYHQGININEVTNSATIRREEEPSVYEASFTGDVRTKSGSRVIVRSFSAVDAVKDLLHKINGQPLEVYQGKEGPFEIEPSIILMDKSFRSILSSAHKAYENVSWKI